ncbi:MAG: AAA family ATPase, partial [Acidimicrobiales bacterium]
MKVAIDGHVERDAQAFVERLLDEEAAILVEGPRGSGKSTLLRAITVARGGTILDLDDPATARLVSEGPSGTVSEGGITFIDEYQRVPDILSAVKREVDRDARPGRFLLAGSVSGRLLPANRDAHGSGPPASS